MSTFQEDNALNLETVRNELLLEIGKNSQSVMVAHNLIYDAMRKMERLEWLLLHQSASDSLGTGNDIEYFTDTIDKILDIELDKGGSCILSKINPILSVFIMYMKPEAVGSFGSNFYHFIRNHANEIKYIESFLDAQSKVIFLRQILLWIIVNMLYIDTHYNTLSSEKSLIRKVIRLLDRLINYNFPHPTYTELPPEAHYRFDVFIKEGDIVMDCGAFEGDTTAAMDKLAGAKGRVYAFEPFKDSYNKLLNLRLNNTECLQKGISKKTGAEHFNVVCGNLGANSVCASGEITIETCSIDEFVKERGIGRLDFIKMDIEGSELDALQGAETSIRRFKPVLAISVYHHEGRDLVDVSNYLCQNYSDIYDYSLFQASRGPAETVMFAVPKQN